MPYLLTITRPNGHTMTCTLTTPLIVRREVIWTLTGQEFKISFDVAREFSWTLAERTPRGTPLDHAATGLALTVDHL